MINIYTSPIDACALHHFASGVFRKYAVNPKSERPIVDFDILTNQQAQFLVDVINTPIRSEYQNIKTFNQYDIPTLVDYLKKSHVEYLNQRLPEIEQTLSNLILGLQNADQLIRTLGTYFEKYRAELIEHIELEEKCLFPYAMNLYRKQVCPIEIPKYSAHKFLHDHTDPSIDIQTIQRLFQNFEPTKISVSPYRVLMEQLKSFDTDLKIHELLEENVLVAKLMALEV